MRHVRFFDRVILRQKKIIGVKQRFLSRSLPFVVETAMIRNHSVYDGLRLRLSYSSSFGRDPTVTQPRHRRGILARFSSDIILDFLTLEISTRRRRTGCKTDEILSRSFLVFPVSRLDFHHLSRLISTDFFFKPRRNSR